MVIKVTDACDLYNAPPGGVFNAYATKKVVERERIRAPAGVSGGKRKYQLYLVLRVLFESLGGREMVLSPLGRARNTFVKQH